MNNDLSQLDDYQLRKVVRELRERMRITLQGVMFVASALQQIDEEILTPRMENKDKESA